MIAFDKTDYEIIRRLKSGCHISSSDFAEQFNVSRNAVWKRVEALRSIGYGIEGSKEGYALTSSPIQAVPEEIMWNLGDDGVHILLFDTIDSTNRMASELGNKNTSRHHIVVARSQTGGKGRFGRKWSSPHNSGLYFSLLLFPDLNLKDITKVTPSAAVSVLTALDNQGFNTGLKIKWPNDIMAGERKLCGILTESESEENDLRFLVTGIGLNLGDSPELPDTAASIFGQKSSTLDQNRFIADVYLEMMKSFTCINNGSWHSIFERWKTSSALIERYVTVRHNKTVIEGKVTGFDEDCSMILQDKNGNMHHFNSGEASLNI